MAVWNCSRVHVPSRTRCHQTNIRLVSRSKARPSRAAVPPRSVKATNSRRRCAQHSCRRAKAHHEYPLQRSLTRIAVLAPSNACAATAPRRRWIMNTVTSAVTATHNQARCRPSRQPVSSAWTTGACST